MLQEPLWGIKVLLGKHILEIKDDYSCVVRNVIIRECRKLCFRYYLLMTEIQCRLVYVNVVAVTAFVVAVNGAVDLIITLVMVIVCLSSQYINTFLIMRFKIIWVANLNIKAIEDKWL